MLVINQHNRCKTEQATPLNPIRTAPFQVITRLEPAVRRNKSRRTAYEGSDGGRFFLKIKMVSANRLIELWNDVGQSTNKIME